MLEYHKFVTRCFEQLNKDIVWVGDFFFFVCRILYFLILDFVTINNNLLRTIKEKKVYYLLEKK